MNRSWVERSRRRARRRSVTRVLALALASQAIPGVLNLHLRYGSLSGWSAADRVATFLPPLMVTLLAAFVLSPERAADAVERVLRATFGRLLTWLSVALLSLLYVASLPAARILGRRAFLRKHPASAPWVRPGEQWQVSTWRTKEPVGAVSGSFLLNTLGYFVQRRSYFLAVMAVLVLLALVLLLLANNPVLGPLVYTIF